MKTVRFHKKISMLVLLIMLMCLLAMHSTSTLTARAQQGLPKSSVENTITNTATSLRCVAFSPYILTYDPNTGNHPPASLISHLLDTIVQTTDYNCIMTYGVNPPIDHIIPAARARGLKVFANIWLDPGLSIPSQNSISIQNGINAALVYPDTIVRLSCGVEVRNKTINNGWPLSSAESVINDCINELRAAGVTQPITTIDTWWNWCNAQWPCQAWSMANNVDWIGINVYPWWENKYSGIFTCTTAANAAQFHIDRINNVQGIYPSKEIVLTEFGWPAGPNGYFETNLYTGEKCGIASELNQEYIISETLTKLNNAGIQGVVFEAFREPWKTVEGSVGPFWGTIAPTFGDAPLEHPYFRDIEILYANGYTGGCSTSPLLFCPDLTMNRAQAAVFMVRGNFGSNYVPVTPTHLFADNWTNVAWAEGWAESMFLENLSGGCSTNPLLFCPEELFTNVQAAVFGLRMKHGVSYQPPAASGTMFGDLTDVNFWGIAWAEEAYVEGLLPACGTSGGKPLFCPNSLVSRGFGASIIVKAKGLTMP
jgi:exo-beta-1,3-glucanase (GH17 family)